MDNFTVTSRMGAVDPKERSRRLALAYKLILDWRYPPEIIDQSEDALKKNAMSAGDAVDMAGSEATPRSNDGDITHGLL